MSLVGFKPRIKFNFLNKFNSKGFQKTYKSIPIPKELEFKIEILYYNFNFTINY